MPFINPKTGVPFARKNKVPIPRSLTDKVTTWGQEIARRSCHRKACVAVARKLAVIMHVMWSDGSFYVGDPAASETDTARRAQIKDRKLLGTHR